MKNIDLNPGGVIGALVGGGIAAAVVFSIFDVSRSGRGPTKLIVLALFGGAFAGNWLWGVIFKKSE